MRRALFLVVTLALIGGLAGLAMPQPPGPKAACAHPRIVITKHLAQLQLVCDEGTRTFPTTFGAQPVGHKQRRGDERTPEGSYHISSMTAPARFHRFMKLSYPSEIDRERARKAGLDPGNGIGIHGVQQKYATIARMFIRGAAKISAAAWGPTDGCIGMINEDVEELYRNVQVGTSVTVLP